MKPIITSLLDTDAYKLWMGQFAFRRYRNVPVRFAFRNRTTSIPLARLICEEELRDQLDAARAMTLTSLEAQYLEGITIDGRRILGCDYIEFLQGLRLPPYSLEYRGDEICLEFEGNWPEVMPWEIIALPIIEELYARALIEKNGEVWAEGRRRLAEKIEFFRQNPGIRFVEFGTRRRASREWQAYVLTELARRLPNQLLGTSNVKLAMELGLEPKGTMAHELFMVKACLAETDEDLRRSPMALLSEWEEEYGTALSIALPDTFGSKSFFEDMPSGIAERWKGFRGDSGDPYEFGESEIAFYQTRGIDPREKLYFPSDGLKPALMASLYERFAGRIGIGFGPGTNLTNDLGLPTPSIVIKVAKANGRPAVKLSDNPAKAMGDPKEVTRYKRVFVYTGGAYVPCDY